MPASSNRRSFLKLLGALPLLGLIAFDDLKQKAWAAAGRSASDSIYTRLGVKPLVNGRGVWTYLSGTLELPEVRAAKQQAATGIHTKRREESQQGFVRLVGDDAALGPEHQPESQLIEENEGQEKNQDLERCPGCRPIRRFQRLVVRAFDLLRGFAGHGSRRRAAGERSPRDLKRARGSDGVRPPAAAP